MRIKRYLTALLAGLSAASALAASDTALTVAVYDFKGQDAAASYGSKVTALVTADLTTQTNLIMLERAELKKALNEQAFGMSGLVSSDAAAQIGAITGAKVLVAGQVIMTEHDHLVIVANIIGTETGRLFAAKVEGAVSDLTGLSSELSSKISDTVASQTTNLLSKSMESDSARLARIINSIPGTKRPAVSVNILFPAGVNRHSSSAECEFGMILLKAGFMVVDGDSDRKPDVEITGLDDLSPGPRSGELFTYRAVIELKVQDRRTGNIIDMDRAEGSAAESTKTGADRACQVRAVDDVAERVLPVLAK